MRGQTAVEYLVVFSTALTLMGVVTVGQMIDPTTDAADDTLYLSQARSAADAIAKAIDTVYSNGPGAVKSVSFQMDARWALELDNAEDEVRVTVQTSEGDKRAGDNLRYGIDNHHSLSGISFGTFTVIVEWPEDTAVPEEIDDSALGEDKIYIRIRPRGR
jgi:uncharacterized protein (UPF0333 family)